MLRRSHSKKVKMSTEHPDNTTPHSPGEKNINHPHQALPAFDVVLMAAKDGKRVSAHRTVLSVSSPYFAAMLTGSMREAAENEVTLNEIQGDILKTLVEFCYSGRLQLRHDNVEMIMVAAAMFQMNSAVMKCTDYLVHQLDPTNCLGILFFAEHYNCNELKMKAEEFTHEEFAEVCENEEFLQLDAAQLAKLIASDSLNVPTEEVVFHCVMDWANFDLDKRGEDLPELLPLVRMSQLLPSFLADRVESVCRWYECLDLLIDAFKWHSLPEKRHEMETPNTRPRNSTVTLIAVGASWGDKSINIERYTPHSDTWSVWHSIGYRNGYNVARMDENLFIVGGTYDDGQILNTVNNLNLTTLTETELRPMNMRRAELCVAVLENNLYAIGGYDGSRCLNTVERWDPVEGTWKYVAPMSTARACAGAAILNGCIYVVGGFNGLVPLRTVECYNPRTNTWTECPSMSVKRRKCWVVVFNGILYAIGGVNRRRACMSVAECYNPETGKWKTIKPMSEERREFGCTVLGKCLLAVGGFINNTVEAYDPETKQWSNKGALTQTYVRVSAMVVPNRFLEDLSAQQD